MIKVIINDKLKSYEADIRDICMAFFPYNDFVYDSISDNNTDNNKYEHIIDNYFNDDLTDSRIENKNRIKRSLYTYLSKLTNKTLYWGILTGIRPVNIVTQIIEYIKYKENYNTDLINNFNNFCVLNNYQIKNNKNIDGIIFDYLKKEYYVSDDKINTLLEIANRELKILSNKSLIDYKNKCSVYISVPFCVSTCLYCSFTSFNINLYNNYIDDYLKALENQLIDFRKNNSKKILTIYIGGGTPTSFDNNRFEKFIKLIHKYLYSKEVIEWTVEAGRPDTITVEKLKTLKKYKITRISINPQTFNQKTLDLIGRKHTVEDVINVYKLAKKMNFNNINMDIILGLPNEKLEDLVNTLINVGKLKPESLTVHMLSLKRASRLNYEKNNWTNEYLAGLHNDNCILYMSKCSKYLAYLLNLKPYYLYRQKNIAGNLENIGYALEKKYCIYNILMMSERHSVYGIGCGAVGKLVDYKNNEKIVTRVEGYKSVKDYINKWI